jgi:hypothetical protein
MDARPFSVLIFAVLLTVDGGPCEPLESLFDTADPGVNLR